MIDRVLRNVELGPSMSPEIVFIKVFHECYRPPDTTGAVCCLTVDFRAPDREDGQPRITGLRQAIPRYLTVIGSPFEQDRLEAMAVSWVCEILEYIAVHEVREAFMYRCKRVFDPHGPETRPSFPWGHSGGHLTQLPSGTLPPSTDDMRASPNYWSD